MKPLKLNLNKVRNTFPYFYFTAVCLLIFFDHLNATGTVWSELLLLLIASVFTVQFVYQFKRVDVILSIVTSFWSCWMLLAAYSDAIKIERWTWSPEIVLVIVFLILNFACSIALILRSKQPVLQNSN